MISLVCPRLSSRGYVSSYSVFRLFIVIFLGFTVWTLYQWYITFWDAVPADNIIHNEEHLSVPAKKQLFLVDTPGCSIPDVDPYDTSLNNIIENVKPISCNGKPPITYTDGETLRINITALNHYDDRLERCQYEKISRPANAESDNVHEYSRPVDFSKDVNHTGAEFLRVACFGERGQLMYVNFHATIISKPDIEIKSNSKFTRFKEEFKPKATFNFLLLGVDSVSRLNFVRHMPKTRQFLINKLNAVELKGYNKVADNTFVNLSPMFAGKFVEELPWNDRNLEIPFDDFAFVWKNASAIGYRTLFAEDAPKIAIFNYEKPGFHRPPADYYLRPFSLAMEDHSSIWSNNHNCMGSRPETLVVLDYIHEFLNKVRNQPTFAFSFITRLTHDGINKAGAADELYLNFFQHLFNEGHLKDTVILFYSDHGMRFGPIRETYVGQLEERLPFLLLALPQYIKQNHPEFVKSLKKNMNRLTTPFDIYETLSSLLYFKGNIAPNKPIKRGMNLLSEIHAERTCADAAIHSHWCTCHKQEIVDPESDAIQLAAYTAVEYINNKLEYHGLLCASLVLVKVSSARVIVPNKKMVPRKSNLHDLLRDVSMAFPDQSASSSEYIITFKTNPGEGMFEANVRVSKLDRTVKVVGEISRINEYGDQSVCIPYYPHKKFCYCNE